MSQAIYKTKSESGLTVKDVEPRTRRVRIMLSKFDNIDSDGDIIRRGAFAKSITERGPESQSGRKIQFLRFHDWERPIGKFVHLEETHDGLVATAELSEAPDGEAALIQYREGIINEHSIGFNYVEDKMSLIELDGKEVKEIKEVGLWEGSAVTFGANPLTPTLDVSKGNRVELLDKINEKMDGLLKGLRTGNASDQAYYRLEMALKVCQQQYNQLLQPTEPLSTQPEVKELKNNSKQFYLNILKR